MILVSVIIPMYNCERYIADALQSVIGQTCNHWELIVVNDGATDHSMQEVESVCSKARLSEKIKIINQRNQGVSAARNRGVAEASGNYILFLDADDILAPECLALLCAAAVEHTGVDMVGGYVANNGVEEDTPVGYYDDNNHEVRRRFFSSLSPQDGYCCNHLVRKAFIEHNRLLFKEGVRYEDTLWKHQAVCAANSYCVIPYYTYNYRRHSASYTMANGWESTQRQFFYIVNTIAMEIVAPLASMQACYYLQQILSLYRNHAKDAYLPSVNALCQILWSNKKQWQSKAIRFYFNHSLALHLRWLEPMINRMLQHISYNE